MLFVGGEEAAEPSHVHVRDVRLAMTIHRAALGTGIVLGIALSAMSCAPQQPSASSVADKNVSSPSDSNAPKTPRQPDPADGIGTKLCISECVSKRSAPCDAVCGEGGTSSDGGSCMTSCCRGDCVRRVSQASASLGKHEGSPPRSPEASATDRESCVNAIWAESPCARGCKSQPDRPGCGEILQRCFQREQQCRKRFP